MYLRGTRKNLLNKVTSEEVIDVFLQRSIPETWCVTFSTGPWQNFGTKGSDTLDTAIRFVPPCRIGTGCMYRTLKLECPLESVVKYCTVLRTLTVFVPKINHSAVLLY
jgi:hypothetical protein